SEAIAVQSEKLSLRIRSAPLRRCDLDELDRVEVSGAAANTLVRVEQHLPLLGDAIDFDMHTLPVDDDVALPEVPEGDGMSAGAVSDIRHAFVELDGIPKQRMLDALDQVTGRSPQAPAV